METLRQVVVPFLVQNWGLVMSLLVWPILTALLTVALRKKTPEEWEAWAMTKPLLAFVVEVMRAAGIDTAKLLVASHRFAQRRAGVVPPDAIRVSSLPESVKTALQNPELRQILIQAAEHLQTPPRRMGSSTSLPLPFPTAPASDPPSEGDATGR